MKNRIRLVLINIALLAPLAATLAADNNLLPGDRGRPGTGMMGGGNNGQRRGPMPPREPVQPAPALSMALALKAARAIDEGCKQYPFGLAIVDSQGVGKLIYSPDRSEPWHGYSAVRKAYTALTFKAPSSQIAAKAREDAELGVKIAADVNLQAQAGGLPLMAGDKLIGAIGVSGAEPGGHDEECALIGLEAIKRDLK